MQRRLALLLLPVLLLLGILAFSQDDAKKPDSPTDKDTCLSCHGPYDKLIQATSNYTTSSGETATPHQFVPHDEKKDIPDCTNCHTAHPLPPPADKSTIEKAKGVDWCYTSCHHAYNLQNCKNCH